MMESQDIKDSFTPESPNLQIDVGISVFGWLYLNREIAHI